MAIIQLQNRGEIRRAVGRLIGAVIISEVTTTGDTASLIDTLGLRGGDDEHNGKEVIIYDATGSIVDGETSRVTDYTGTGSDATVAPVFTANVTDGDKYEMWEDWLSIDELDDLINQEIIRVSPTCPIVNVDTTVFTELNKYRYAIPSAFTAISKVEYEDGCDVSGVIGNALWTAATSVTAAQDTVYTKGHVTTKLTVGGAVAAGAQLAYLPITLADLSGYDTVEVWLRSSIAQTAANIEFRLCSDAIGAVAVDTISLPALTAGEWKRAQLSMTNPELDTATLSLTLTQKAATDIGACTLWVEYVFGIKATSRTFTEVVPNRWGIIRGSTAYIELNSDANNLAGGDKNIRLTGYRLPALFTSDTVDSEIDPSYLVNSAAANVLLNRYRGQRLDTKARGERAAALMRDVELRRRTMTVSLLPNTRSI